MAPSKNNGNTKNNTPTNLWKKCIQWIAIYVFDINVIRDLSGYQQWILTDSVCLFCISIFNKSVSSQHF